MKGYWITQMKKIIYVGKVQEDIGFFTNKAKQRIMTALTEITAGLDLSPKEFKHFASVGLGCYELRIKVEKQYRVFYVTKFQEAIYVLHAFVKKTQQTSKSDIDLGKSRYKALLTYRREMKYDKKD